MKRTTIASTTCARVIKALAVTPQDELSGEVEELLKTLAEVDADLARNCTLLNPDSGEDASLLGKCEPFVGGT